MRAPYAYTPAYGAPAQQARYGRYAPSSAPAASTSGDAYASAAALGDAAASQERNVETIRQRRAAMLSEATAAGEAYVTMLTDGLGLPRDVAEARLAEARTAVDTSMLPRAAQIFRHNYTAYESEQRAEIDATERARAARLAANDAQQREAYAARAPPPQPRYAPPPQQYQPQLQYYQPASQMQRPYAAAAQPQYAPQMQPQYAAAHQMQMQPQPQPQPQPYAPASSQPQYAPQRQPQYGASAQMQPQPQRGPGPGRAAAPYGAYSGAAVGQRSMVGSSSAAAELEQERQRLGLGRGRGPTEDRDPHSTWNVLRRACEDCGVSICTGPRKTAVLRQKRDALKDAYAHIVSSDWGLPAVEDGVSIWRKRVKGARVDPMLCEGVVVDIEPRVLARLLTDETFKRQSDASIEQLRAIEVIDEWTCVWHQEDRYFWPLANRDNVFLCTIQERANGSVLVVEQSIKDHPFCPPTNKCVRVDSFFAYLLTKQGRNTRMKLFAQFDLGGNIPRALVSMGLSDSTCKNVNKFIRTAVGQSTVARLRAFDEQLAARWPGRPGAAGR